LLPKIKPHVLFLCCENLASGCYLSPERAGEHFWKMFDFPVRVLVSILAGGVCDASGTERFLKNATKYNRLLTREKKIHFFG
jgi:hypothetical protein